MQHSTTIPSYGLQVECTNGANQHTTNSLFCTSVSMCQSSLGLTNTDLNSEI